MRDENTVKKKLLEKRRREFSIVFSSGLRSALVLRPSAKQTVVERVPPFLNNQAAIVLNLEC